LKVSRRINSSKRRPQAWIDRVDFPRIARVLTESKPPSAAGLPATLLGGYHALDGTYDELVEASGATRQHANMVALLLEKMTPDTFARCQALAELALAQRGVTFSVYSDDRGTEKVMPVCLVPRVIAAAEWTRLERGLIQRLTALQLFLDDLYGDQRLLADRVIPGELVHGSKHYLPQLRGLRPPGGVRIHIAGIDLIRSPDGVLRVLEDNLRTPSGVSYVIENRLVTKRVFPTAMDRIGVRRVDDYPTQLVERLRSVSPKDPDKSTIVVLTPGPFNSAYFEHSFLAQQMGVQLVEGRDLVVSNGDVFMKTTKGPERVDVIYRRVDDDFLDPETFRSDSLLGVPGLMAAYHAGRVALANAPGNGVADDKVIYAYVPDMIRYYEGADPILPNVPTYLCWRDSDRQHVLGNLDKLVVKAANESGGYGMLVGPHASAADREAFAAKIRANPRNYIAQPTLALSRAPTIIDDHFEGRHVDLRPYVLCGKEIYVLPGGLTRVAMRKGSLVVNSSQGGGSKDTWVLS
jgi:uncharacterized circularly permuted ATP-grasp superfamily protein